MDANAIERMYAKENTADQEEERSHGLGIYMVDGIRTSMVFDGHRRRH